MSQQVSDITERGTFGDHRKRAIATPVGGVKAAALVSTKMLVPPTPQRLIIRSRLLQALDAGSGRKLTLIIAPAGYGKTVLMSSWLVTAAPAVGWVSLDTTDQEPSRFWSYVITALAGAGADVSAAAQDLLEPAGTAGPAETVGPLINALARMTSDVVLVLDDYHLITTPGIHRQVAYLIERQPRHLRLVLLTRSDPPFSLSRWKVDGDVAELRARQLAFTSVEATEFLDGSGVRLSPDLLESLLMRINGWPAGLRLVTMWMAASADQEAAVTEFAFGDATLADYLTNEVLAQLPAGYHHFLIRTSVLPRLTGSLCDAVTGETGGAETLSRLFAQGLFVEAVDRRGGWFRYHQLFADLLQEELRREGPEAIQDIHRRASVWFADNDFTGEAIDHGILAQDWAGVRRLKMLSEMMAMPATVPNQIASGRVGPDALTDRERTVLRLLRGRLSNAGIAATLGISTNTLKTHVRNVYRKLGVDSRRSAVLKGELSEVG